MFQLLSKLGLAAALCGLMLVPSIAWGQGRARLVDDGAGIFSQGALNEANKGIEAIKKKHKKDLVIETTDKAIPKDDRTTWAAKRFDTMGIDGVYVVIIKNDGGLSHRIVVGNGTRNEGYFDTEARDKLSKNLKERLPKSADESLREIVNFTQETMNKHVPKTTTAPPKKKPAEAPAPAPAPAPVAQNNNNQGEGTSVNWVGWICLIVGILLVVWVVFALIRALSGGMGGGYGQPGYGGGMMGGGGFFTGLLGGMFGAMAGMWMYNHFFGGHSSYSDWGMSTPPGHTPTGEPVSSYEGDTGVGGTAGEDADVGGGDADVGGGDAGGGGDWGGGGGDDAGGGGDWGGGGGDAGGGGDWGGGGGGDWGGGGGDFGGGGGGDW